jgi:hypothetical protein
MIELNLKTVDEFNGILGVNKDRPVGFLKHLHKLRNGI